MAACVCDMRLAALSRLKPCLLPACSQRHDLCHAASRECRTFKRLLSALPAWVCVVCVRVRTVCLAAQKATRAAISSSLTLTPLLPAFSLSEMGLSAGVTECPKRHYGFRGNTSLLLMCTLCCVCARVCICNSVPWPQSFEHSITMRRG